MRDWDNSYLSTFHNELLFPARVENVSPKIIITEVKEMYMYKRAAESARTLVLAAIVVQVVFFVIGIAILSLAIGLIIGSGQTTVPGNQALFIISIVFGFLFIFGLLWIFLNYYLVYKPIVARDLYKAEGPALALGIIELIFDGLIPGVLLIIAYSRIGDALMYEESEKEKKPE